MLWTAVGALTPYAGRKPTRQVLFGIMLLHYLGVAVVPFFDELPKWKYFETMGGISTRGSGAEVSIGRPNGRLVFVG